MKPVIKSWLAGWFAATAFDVFMQDRFGSLEGYIAHLREANTWVQLPLWIPVVVFMLCVYLYAKTYFEDSTHPLTWRQTP